MGVSQHEDNKFIVTELMDGNSLDSLLYDIGEKKKNITFTLKLTLLMDIARGVDYLHGVAKIFHRDLKPSNCLVC